VFPYGYLDSFENFNATQLPSSIDSFYNFLVKKIVVYMTIISQRMYGRHLTVERRFNFSRCFRKFYENVQQSLMVRSHLLYY